MLVVMIDGLSGWAWGVMISWVCWYGVSFDEERWHACVCEEKSENLFAALTQ